MKDKERIVHRLNETEEYDNEMQCANLGRSWNIEKDIREKLIKFE